MMMGFELYPHKCRNCGKTFECGKQWAYKASRGGDKFWWYCSWKCVRQWEKDHQDSRKPNMWMHKQ